MHQDSNCIPVKTVLPHLSQPKSGYRYSSDAVVLGAFAAQMPTHSWVDLGTGCGVLAYKLVTTWPDSVGLAMERSPLAIAHARHNLETLPVSVVQGDLRNFPFGEARFDLAVCNPPFYDAHAFRKNLNREIREARHVLYGDIIGFAKAIQPALKPKGRFCFVFPKDLVDEKVNGLLDLGFHLQRKLTFASFQDRPPHRVCLEFGLGVGEVVASHLTLYQKPGFYTQEAWRFLQTSQMKGWEGR